MRDVGKKIYSRGRTETGVITGYVYRWCAGCGKVMPRYSVKWGDGRRTYPCPAGCKDVDENTIEIE